MTVAVLALMVAAATPPPGGHPVDGCVRLFDQTAIETSLRGRLPKSLFKK